MRNNKIRTGIILVKNRRVWTVVFVDVDIEAVGCFFDFNSTIALQEIRIKYLIEENIGTHISIIESVLKKSL